MSAETRHARRLRVARLVGAALIAAAVGSLLVSIPAAAKNEAPKLKQLHAKATPARAKAAAVVLPDIDLCAKTNGAWDIGPTNVPIWGFALDEGAAGCSDDTAQLPGPVLGVDTATITAGDTLTINLTNVDVPENISVVIPGASGADPPDTVGVPAGGVTSYTFTFDGPGTYLYQTGVQSSAAQVGIPMGLYGALVVRSTTPMQAYDEPWTAYDSEEILVLSEIDPALNADPDGSSCAPDPPNCHLLEYNPTYWLINGEAYPDTDPIAADSGDRLLLRYLNAGSFHHGMELLGAHQRVIAKDAFPGYPYDVVAETIAAGQTMDAITTPCALGTPADTELPLFNSNSRLTNVNDSPGGMLTFVNLTGTACPAAGNIAPMVDAGPDQTVAATTATLDGTVWDDFVTPVNATWSGPGGVTFADAADVDTTATFPAPGVYTLTLTADDGTSMDFDTVDITIVSNTSPTVDAGPDQTITFPDLASLDGTVTDDGASPLTTLWTKQSGPGTVTFGDASAVDTTASFSVAGVYVLRLTADDGVNPPVFDEVTITVQQPTLLYFSTAGNVSLGLPNPDDADIYVWHGGTNYSRFFDASANGVDSKADVDALKVVDSDTFYVSFGAATTLPVLGAVESQDVVKFDEGTWSMFLDGSAVGLDTKAENVDAFEILSATQVAVSTSGDPNVPNISGEQDEDLLRCTSAGGFPTASCTWSYYLDGSDAGIGLGQEDVDGAAVAATTGQPAFVTTDGNFTVPGPLSGADEDVLRCAALTIGAGSNCTGGWTLFFDGSANGLTDDLDAIDRP
jgi:plastocyanin